MASQRTLKKKHHHRAAKHFPVVFERCGGRCVWCGRSVMRVSIALRNYSGPRITHDSIEYLTQTGETVKVQIASLDHVVPVRDGGSDELENLVLACTVCNRKRTAEPEDPTSLKSAKKVWAKTLRKCYRKARAAGGTVEGKDAPTQAQV